MEVGAATGVVERNSSSALTRHASLAECSASAADTCAAGSCSVVAWQCSPARVSCLPSDTRSPSSLLVFDHLCCRARDKVKGVRKEGLRSKGAYARAEDWRVRV